MNARSFFPIDIDFILRLSIVGYPRSVSDNMRHWPWPWFSDDEVTCVDKSSENFKTFQIGLLQYTYLILMLFGQ